MAVCSYVTRTNAMPALLALLPQPEELDGDEQVTMASIAWTTCPSAFLGLAYVVLLSDA
jgi:hypothetical protein